MTESRSIAGLTRRAGEQDLSRLRRQHRQPQDAPPPAPDPVPAPPSAAASSPPHVVGEKTKTTIYLDRELRSRARAAFKATSHLEDDRTWSQFIEKAIANEVQRRQDLHNDGAPYPADNTPLAPGRPID